MLLIGAIGIAVSSVGRAPTAAWWTTPCPSAASPA